MDRACGGFVEWFNYLAIRFKKGIPATFLLFKKPGKQHTGEKSAGDSCCSGYEAV
jgi:hypothetical protein